MRATSGGATSAGAPPGGAAAGPAGVWDAIGSASFVSLLPVLALPIGARSGSLAAGVPGWLARVSGLARGGAGSGAGARSEQPQTHAPIAQPAQLRITLRMA